MAKQNETDLYPSAPKSTKDKAVELAFILNPGSGEGAGYGQDGKKYNIPEIINLATEIATEYNQSPALVRTQSRTRTPNR